MTNTQPKSITGNNNLQQLYAFVPKRVLWDILWDAAARMCLLGQESPDRAVQEPEARGSIVEWLTAEAAKHDVWLPKAFRKEAPKPTTAAEDTPHESVEPKKKGKGPRSSLERDLKEARSKPARKGSPAATNPQEADPALA